MTEMEIANEISVDQTTVSRDIKAIHNLYRSFVNNLAKSDFAVYYKECIDGIDEAKKEAWWLFHNRKLTAANPASLEDARFMLMSLDVAIRYKS